MNPVPATALIPDSISAYHRGGIVSDVSQLVPRSDILSRHPGLTPAHLAAVALALVADIDSDLEHLATGGPAAEPRDRVNRVARLCERRHGLLAHAGSPQTRDEARGHLARALLRIQVLNSPAASPGQPQNALAGLARSWGAAAPGGRARAILDDALRSATPAIRSHLMASGDHHPRFLRARAEIPAAEARAEYEGEGSPAAARLAGLRADLDDARARAGADAGRVVGGLAARVVAGDLAAYVEALALHEAAAAGDGVDMRARLLEALLEALLEEGPARFVDVPPDWPGA